MIYWLMESMANHRDIARGICPDGLLNAAEQRQLNTLHVDKRRREWLLGRWTAKRLLQTMSAKHHGRHIPFELLTIVNAPSGAPVASGRWSDNVTLSISHRGTHAFSAALLRPVGCVEEHCALGADLELIEKRSVTFAEDYFTGPECAALARVGHAARDLMTTVTWSAKEAALKAARLGLTVDTRAVTCQIGPATGRADAWAPFAVQWDDELLDGIARPELQGWWRQVGDFVLTLAARRALEGAPAPAPVDDIKVFA